MKACVRLLCRPYTNWKPACTAIKLCAPSVLSIKLLYELFPQSKLLFMYRDIEKNSKSIYRLAQELPLLKMCFTLGKYSDYFVEVCMNALGFSGKDFKIKLIDDIDFSLYIFAVMCREYVKLRKENIPCYAMRYEDIVSKTTKFEATKAFIEFCGLPGDLTEKALRGLELDSQRNTPISMEILKRHKDPELTPGAKTRANEYLKQFGLPLIGSNGILAGTITTNEPPAHQ